MNEVMRFALVLSVCCAAAVAAGCGSSSRSTFGGTIHLARGVQAPTSVMGIEAGTSSADVRAQLGAPTNTNHDRGLSCWWYRADQPSSSVDGIGFCMTPARRVGRIIVSVHL